MGWPACLGSRHVMEGVNGMSEDGDLKGKLKKIKGKKKENSEKNKATLIKKKSWNWCKSRHSLIEHRTGPGRVTKE